VQGFAAVRGGARRSQIFQNYPAVNSRTPVNLQASVSFRARVSLSTPVVFVWGCRRTAMPIGHARFVGPGSNTRYGCGRTLKAEPHSHLPQ
jgi:hypothetical protein